MCVYVTSRNAEGRLTGCHHKKRGRLDRTKKALPEGERRRRNTRKGEATLHCRKEDMKEAHDRLMGRKNGVHVW